MNRPDAGDDECGRVAVRLQDAAEELRTGRLTQEEEEREQRDRRSTRLRRELGRPRLKRPVHRVVAHAEHDHRRDEPLP